MTNNVARTALRYIRTLERMPRWPTKTTASQLRETLENEGFSVSKRTVERDLNTFLEYFPITHDEGTPKGWSWAKDARLIELPSMSPATALAFLMLNEFSRPLLPNNMRSFLDQHLNRARHLLEEIRDRDPGMSEWSDLVAIAPRSQPMVPPRGDEGAIRVTYDALLKGCRFSGVYHAASKDGEARHYQINPLGLILRDHLLYLVCTLANYEDIRLLALHRLEHAELVDEPGWKPKDFDLHDYVHSGVIDISQGPDIELVADFDTQAARHLKETPLSQNQILEQRSQDIVRVTVRVPNTKQLRWWLQGFGSAVEVIKPSALREEMAATARAMLSRYQ